MAKSYSLVSRVTFLSVIGIVITVLVAGSALIWAYNQTVQRSLNSYIAAYLDVLVAATVVDKDGTVTVQQIDGLQNIPRYWQVNYNGLILAKSESLVEPVMHVPQIEGRYYFTDLYNTPVVSYVRNIHFPDNVTVTYMFGMQEDIARAYLDAERHQFFKVLMLVLVLVVVIVGVFAFLQVRMSITPLFKVRQALRHVRDGNTKEVEGTYPIEIQELADELNLLLLSNATIVERYRTFSANLAHALKTPLTVLKNEATKNKGKIMKSKLAEVVAEKTDVMLGLVERNLARVKVAGSGHIIGAKAEVENVAERIVKSFGKLYDVNIDASVDDGLLFKGDEGDLYEVMGNVIENACKHAKENVNVHVYDAGDGMLEMVVEDDGKGILDEEKENVLGRGVRLDEAKPGAGIGLSIVQDIVEMYGGDIALKDSEMGGLLVRIGLPLAGD